MRDAQPIVNVPVRCPIFDKAKVVMLSEPSYKRVIVPIWNAKDSEAVMPTHGNL
jgi:hypothetical protein